MWKVSAGIVSVACCLLFAWTLGGAPSWAGYLLVVAILVPVAGLVGSAILEKLPSRRPGGARPVMFDFDSVVEPDEESPAFDRSDQLLLEPVFALIDRRRTIDWLRTENFRSPWPDVETDPLRDLLDAADGQTGLAGAFRHSLVQTLLSATREFLDYYDRHTISDPLLSGGDWRELDPGTDAEAVPTEEAQRALDERVAELRERALVVARGYEALFRASGMQLGSSSPAVRSVPPRK